MKFSTINYSLKRFFLLFSNLQKLLSANENDQFRQYLCLFQIKPIKTAEFRLMQIEKKKAKTLRPVDDFEYSKKN